jgi:hypothetical protein
MIRAIGFVHHEDDIGIRLTQELRYLFVDGINARACVYDEDDEVGGLHCDTGFESDRI